MNELDRIRAEYARRAMDPRLQGRYSLFRPGALFTVQTRERAVLRLLKQAGFEPLDRLDILEMGCGEGSVLVELLRWGADPARLYGCDLLPDRLSSARRRLPVATALALADGGALPYPSGRFTLVLQFTVFTSVLDPELRQRMAAEMWRVLRPGGAVLWYDFRFQGFNNPAVRAIHPRQVRALFPQGTITARRVTLAPPIARQLAGWSWLGCELLDRLPWLCTHDLILIRKSEARDD
ncbi:MAG: class I SAM-dependent methyltransferase [Anaerolineae bacterium]